MKQEMKEYNEVLKDVIKNEVIRLMLWMCAMFISCFGYVLACMRVDHMMLYGTTFLSAVALVSFIVAFLKVRKLLYNHFKFMEDVAEVTEELIK